MQSTAASDVVIPHRQVTMAPLSMGQHSTWQLAQVMPGATVSQQCVVIDLPSALNVASLERSLMHIIRRHEMWRTGFPIVDQRPTQVVHTDVSMPLSTVDLRSLPVGEREVAAVRVAAEEAQRPFDLTQAPLLRATLLHVSDTEHRLVVTAHRLTCDDASLYQIFPRELCQLYETSSSNTPPEMPDLPVSYADVAIEQGRQLSSVALADDLAFWKRQLAGAPALLELPTDRPRPPAQTGRASAFPFALSSHVADRLDALAGQAGTSREVVHLAVLATLLHRYTGQSDIVMGLSSDGRTRPEFQSIVGPFHTALPVRTDLSGDPTFSELLSTIRVTTTATMTHQAVPMEYLIQELQLRRDHSYHPLFQALLTVTPALPALGQDWGLRSLDVSPTDSPFDLSFELRCDASHDTGLKGRIVYCTDLFDEATIARMVGHWMTLIEGVVADPDRPLSRLPLLTSTERERLMVEWNDTHVDYPSQSTLHELFEAQAERTPDALALVQGGRQLTYRALNERANQLARHLQQMGVGPETLVGICVERSPEMMTGILGILKAGGAYVPLDPAYPKERLAFMLEDCAAPVVVTQSHLADGLSEHQARVVRLDADWPVIAGNSCDNLCHRVAPENLAYIIYTSGSTGLPKGVLVSHRNVVNSTCARPTYYQAPVIGYLMLYSFAFDGSVGGIYWTLCTGGALVLPDRGEEHDPAALAEIIAQGRVSHVDCVTSLYSLLLSHADPRQLGSLRAVIVGGEVTSEDIARRHYERLPHVPLYNEYGPTETTVWSTVYQAQPDEWRATVPIGRPIANTRVYVLDQQFQPVPIGVPGELYIGGEGVTRGYLRRPELTDERFIPNPFMPETGDHLYKTGDLVRYLADGNLLFVGRADTQVKLHGYRIELGEVESALRKHPAVRDAAATAREDTPGDQRLVAYVVPADAELPSYPELRRHLQLHLPEYMIPSRVLTLDALPLSPNGKVDRSALPAPHGLQRSGEQTYIPPRWTVHHQLLAIWEDLLDARPIGIRDNFFDLGGTSFLAARLIGRIEHLSGQKLSLETLFAGPTIEELANALVGEWAARPSVAAEDATSSMRAPLIPIQAGGSKVPFFYLHADWRGGAFYCYPLARALGPDQPFYVLEPYRFEGLAVPDFAAMVTAHCRAIQTVQPEGPYLLGGFCAGAVVAGGIARQLQESGQRVDLLLLMNPTGVSAHHRLFRRAITGLGDMLHVPLSTRADGYLQSKHLWRQAISTVHMAATGDRSGQAERLFLSREALRRNWPDVFDWVAADVMPRRYSGKITFFWSSDEPTWNMAKWVDAMRAGEVELRILPGDNQTCRTTYLPAFAEHLRRCVVDAQRG